VNNSQLLTRIEHQRFVHQANNKPCVQGLENHEVNDLDGISRRLKREVRACSRNIVARFYPCALAMRRSSTERKSRGTLSVVSEVRKTLDTRYFLCFPVLKPAYLKNANLVKEKAFKISVLFCICM